ncbi:MAG: hypothetical protein IT366_17680 [Candidatus Hydrogenedentes bacterium]|nr:hypothetical protein [Candidatus Hydrogenedentota bacterium]
MHKNRAAVLSALVGLALVGVAGYFFVRWADQIVGVEFAEDQTRIFEEMRRQSRDMTGPEAVNSLNYVVTYYPSGSKQRPGSKLDRIVERARASAIREIIAALRVKTGKDLGDDPAVWIRAYMDSRDTPAIVTQE